MAVVRDHVSTIFAVAAVGVLLTMASLPLISSGENQPPTITVPDYPRVAQNVRTLFVVMNASDPDGDQLRFTWFWGDGTLSVTTVPQAVHSYSMRRTFTLTVWADDQTGLEGHNVSDSNYVVVGGAPSPPQIISFSASSSTAEIGAVVTFKAVVYDVDGGVLRMTYNYGGGVYDVWQTPTTLPWEVVTHNETNAFATPGTKIVTLSVMDTTGMNTTTSPIALTIAIPNQKPEVSPLIPFDSYVGVPVVLTGDAFDTDNMILRYTWDLGDDSGLRVGQSITYTYSRAGTFTVTLYVDDLTGLAGHNVSVSAAARIAFRLNLVSGWNLISLPMVTTYKASTLPLAHGDQVLRWNGTYHIFIAGLPLSDFPIEPSTGYWIYTSTAKTLTLYGTTPTVQQSRYIVVPAGGGWALVGLCSMKTTWKASDLAAMYSGGRVTAVVKYTPPGTIPPIEPVYTTFVVGLPLNNFFLVPGAGYWIYVTGSGTLAYYP